MEFAEHIGLLDQNAGKSARAWRIQVKDVLMANKVWQHVNGEHQRPQEKSAAQEWDSQDALARLIIRRFLVDYLVKKVVVLATSQETWDYLEGRAEALADLRVTLDDGPSDDELEFLGFEDEDKRCPALMKFERRFAARKRS